MKISTKTLAVLLALVMLLTSLPIFAVGQSAFRSGVRVYGYRIFDDDETLSYAWISMMDDSPSVVTEENIEENAFDDYTDMSAGTFMGGHVYGFAENGGFYKIDVTDWSRERLFSDGTAYHGWSDMTFDYTNGKLYAIAYTQPWESGGEDSTIEASYLVSIDLYDYSIDEVAQITTGIITLAADRQGQLYGIAMDGCLYAINKSDGSCRIIGDTGMIVSFAQSMCYDYNTDTMYWAMCNITQGNLCTVDLETGRASNLGVIGGNTEVTCLFTVPNDEPVIHVESVEALPSNLELNVGTSGMVSAQVLPEIASERHVIWTSDNPGVASVDVNGTVYANSIGAATITATTVDGGLTASCAVEVTSAPTTSDYRLVDELESDEEFIIVTYFEGQAYALVNRNANSNGFAAKLIPIILTDDGEYVLAAMDSNENFDDMVWLVQGDYVDGFSFKSITNDLFFAGLNYCNWTAINGTEDKWLPVEQEGVTLLKSMRALDVNEDSQKFYVGTTDAYYNSVIFDYVQIGSACEVFFFKHIEDGGTFTIGDVNEDGEVNLADAALILRYALGIHQFTDTQLLAADINSDGEINASDAALLLRIVMGI